MKLVYLYYLIPFIVALLAQLTKLVIDSRGGTKKAFHGFLVSGGMPSAHSTLTSSLLTLVLLLEQGLSELSMIVIVFTLLVWYDAANVRYESGKHAQYINSLKREMSKVMTQTQEEYLHPHLSSPLVLLKERLGHTPTEVFAGIAFGALLTYIFFLLLSSYIVTPPFLAVG